MFVPRGRSAVDQLIHILGLQEPTVVFVSSCSSDDSLAPWKILGAKVWEIFSVFHMKRLWIKYLVFRLVSWRRYSPGRWKISPLGTGTYYVYLLCAGNISLEFFDSDMATKKKRCSLAFACSVHHFQKKKKKKIKAPWMAYLLICPILWFLGAVAGCKSIFISVVLVIVVVQYVVLSIVFRLFSFSPFVCHFHYLFQLQFAEKSL